MKMSKVLLVTCVCLLKFTSSKVIDPLNVLAENSKISLPNAQAIDDEGKVMLAWEVDKVMEIITFEIEANTTGFVGFGISPQGSMTGADIFIAGVFPNGTSYSSDRFANETSMPKIDDHADWTLLNASESSGVTYLKFSRAFNTCDDEDYPITEDTNRLIWSMGATDTIEYHTSARRGSRSVHLRGAQIPDLDLTSMTNFPFTIDMLMPTEKTTYWCSFHKGPVLQKEHHVVAFDAVLENADALKYTHHFILYNCLVPKSDNRTADEIFGNFTVDKTDGSLCYGPESAAFPNQYCQEYLFVWAKGGKTMKMPENLGYPISEGEDAGESSYYMLEIHYDNPEHLTDRKFKTGAEFYYTDTLRPTKAGLMTIGAKVDISITVPPQTDNFVVAGHCSPECTEKLNDTGVTIFNSLLHSHLSGRALKLRHFRKGTDGSIQELPFIDHDEHYDFDYQQNKPLVNYVQVLPGDHIIYECTYSSKWKNGTVVSGGLTTEDEMCQAFLWYYPKNNFDHCASSYPLDKHIQEFGVTKSHKNSDAGFPLFFIDEPESLIGQWDDSISNKFNWTKEFQDKYTESRRYGEHSAYCKSEKLDQEYQISNQKYPDNFVPYVPEDKCAINTPSPTGSTDLSTGSTEKSAGTQVMTIGAYALFTLLALLQCLL